MPAPPPWLTAAISLLEVSLTTLALEKDNLDWKRTLSENKERLAEHLSAFANYPGGGYLVFGISDLGQVVGLDSNEARQLVADIANLGRDALLPPLTCLHEVVEFRQRQILLVHVCESGEKPVHRRGKSIEEAWIRSNATTRKASRQEVAQLMLNSAAPRWETVRATSMLRADEVPAAIDVDGLGSLLGKPVPADEVGKLRWLEDEKFIQADGRGYYVTNLGAISGARMIENFPGIKRKAARVVRYSGTDKINMLGETSGKFGYAIGFKGLIEYVQGVLPHSEVIEQALRRKVTLYPEVAIREIVANSLIHQDFSVTGAGPIIDIFSDRIEISNPGALIHGKNVDRLIGATPQSRNEDLASTFRRFGICEERGSGFQRAVEAIEFYGMPPMRIQSIDTFLKVTLFAPKDFSDMSGEERIEATYQHACLLYFSNKAMTNTSLRIRFKLGDKYRTQVSNLIAQAASAGRIKRKNNGDGHKFAEYEPYWV
jgi:ATP-dependent DNA helicase RecG